MLTVSELAKDLNVSVQTIYRALNNVKQRETAEITEKHKGITYLTTIGENFIRDYLKPVKQDETECSTELNDVKHSENDEILFLRGQNKALLQELEKEREHSRQQSDRISDLAAQLAELTRNSQILLKQEQEKNTLLISNEQPFTASSESSEPPSENKKAFWRRWRK